MRVTSVLTTANGRLVFAEPVVSEEVPRPALPTEPPAPRSPAAPPSPMLLATGHDKVRRTT